MHKLRQEPHPPRSHTPGPWIVSRFSPLRRGWTAVHGDPEQDGWTLVAEAQTERDARLIAAAPDMLAALEEVESYFDDRADVVDGSYGIPEPNKEMSLLTEIRTAIAKAIG